MSRALEPSPFEDDEMRIYPHIIMRDSPAGQIAQIAGTRLQVWEILSIWHSLDNDVRAVSAKYGIDCTLIDEALRYAEAHPGEIATATRYSEEFDTAELERILSSAAGVHNPERH